MPEDDQVERRLDRFGSRWNSQDPLRIFHLSRRQTKRASDLPATLLGHRNLRRIHIRTLVHACPQKAHHWSLLRKGNRKAGRQEGSEGFGISRQVVRVPENQKNPSRLPAFL